MRARITALLAAVLLALGVAWGAVPAAQAAPSYVTGYHYYEGYAYHPAGSASVYVSFHATNSYSQVWINGGLSCSAYNGARITRCAWYGNGANLAHAGVNYTANGGSQWYQFNVEAPVRHVPHELWCTPHGSAPVTVVLYCPGHIG